jgi:hypothetical protein
MFQPKAGGGFAPLCETTVATEPVGLAARGQRLFVASGYGRRLTELDARDFTVRRNEPLPRAPRAVVVAADGQTAYVSHAVGGVVSAVDLRAEPRDRAEVDLRVGRKGSFFEGDRPLRDANQGFALALSEPFAGEERLFVPQVAIDTGATDEPISLGYGASEQGPRALAPFVATIDVASKRRLTQDVGSERTATSVCTLPRAVVARGNRLWLACAGIDQVIELDARGTEPSALEYRRFAVGAGPEGIAVDGERLIVWSRFDHELARIALEGDGTVDRQRLARRTDSPIDPIYARGRVLFHRTNDPRISRGDRACASCHPDGLDDGLVWTSPDGRRQTKRLAGRLTDSAPYGWFGRHQTLAEHLTETVARLGGGGFHNARDRADLDALVHFIEHMPAPKRDVVDDERVARGRALFEDAAHGCGHCHEAGTTNGSTYDVGSAPKGARHAMFDTPSLRFVGDSAPYYHDGRFGSLRELLVATDGLMGHTSSLSPDDLNALETYLRTL